MDTILLTGGTGGLGSVAAHALIAHGYRCIVPYTGIGPAQSLRASVVPQQRDQLILIEANLTHEADMDIINESVVQFGGLYGLVHLVGGIRSFQPVSQTTAEDWDYLMSLNLRSFFLASRLAMRHFEQARRGRIVSVGAMAAVKPAAGQGAYGAAKAGVAALTRILADEGRACGVTANCIAPGVIRTPANLSWGSEEEARTWTTPEEIASMIVFLLGESAQSVNGTVIRMFGKMAL